MTGDELLRALGYRRVRGRWHLVDTDAKPPRRPGLCRACQMFDGHPDWEGLCAACLWFGPNNPHGVARERLRERLRARREAGGAGA